MAVEKQPPTLPILLEIAQLPREQIGPFLLLGIDKTADKEEIEASWAQRLIAARKKQLHISLEDINWAIDVLGNPETRARADAVSLNVDTIEGTLRKLGKKTQDNRFAQGFSKPIDEEKNLSDYTLPVPLPDGEEIRRSLPAPEIPHGIPAVTYLLEQYLQTPLDPWQLDVSS